MFNDVRSFYKNKNILLTGGTGFLGKLIIEKLLRTCDVEGVYLIVKSKKGLTPEERIKNLIDEPVMAKVREKDPEKLKKIHVIDGNLTKKDLGLSVENKEIILNKVNIVFHCGASLNMDLKLQESVITNVRGTMEIVNIVNQSKHIHSFILVSTAYSNCYEHVIEEKFYEPPINPELLIRMCEEIDPDMLSNISLGLIGKWQNSYVFTKSVAENIVFLHGRKIPAGVFRPAIVTSTVAEPLPGWSDNLYGPLGILLASHCGILRVIKANGNLRNHTVPGDMCINAILCFAWDLFNKWETSKENYTPSVLNFSAKDTKLYITSKEFVDCKNIDYLPFKKTMWYQILFLVKSKYNYFLLKFLVHSIPAYLIDMVLKISSRKTRMKSIYAKIEKTSDILSYFLLHEWDIHNENMKLLWQKLNSDDKETFNFDVNSIEVNVYLKNVLIGLKKYILKEDMTKSKLHKQRYERLTVVHKTIKYSFYGLVSILMYRSLTRFVLKKNRV
ncbi:fatty acyl-CoA reductase wat-like [Diorhabda carinulata]|uniref:fatty acyl-CoA reductase wat-like n=1 Tax=Diorhabda carinulata TaxID=1163345 RepID=UPI0025A1B5B4|nr:fatty acyl-CoA reductase wat-like [Diorhabda carinulata]